ncbi:MAG: hypothetical protein K9I74_14800 [Bacteroidales bacterium]|nr:hypothetical protein [Bacteroidales bacterium]
MKDRVKDKVISVIKNGKESIIKAKKLKNKITELKNKIDNLYAEKAQLEVTENIKVTENIINELKEIEGEIARSDISHSTIPTNQNTTFNDALTKARELKDFFEEKKNEMGERQLLAEYEKKIEQAKTVSELEKLVDEIYDIHVTSLYEEQDRVADLANKKIRQIRISKKREQMQKYANKAGVLDKYLEKRLYMFAEEDFLLKDFIAAVVKAKQYKKFTKSHLDSNLYILELKNSSELFFKLGKFYPENQQFYDDLSEDVKGYPCFLLSKIKSSKGSKKMSSLRESGMIIDKLYVQFTQISEGYR